MICLTDGPYRYILQKGQTGPHRDILCRNSIVVDLTRIGIILQKDVSLESGIINEYEYFLQLTVSSERGIKYAE